MKGYLQVYTGDGKGKTTAAIGLAVRAAGAGFNVFIAQFMKRGDYSEIAGLRPLADHITVEQFGTGRFVRGAPDAEDLAAARAGLARVAAVFAAGSRAEVAIIGRLERPGRTPAPRCPRRTRFGCTGRRG